MAESTEVRLAVLEEQIKASRIEIEKQAREYLRRLDELNHAHSQNAADKINFVSSEKFDGYVENQDAWRSKVDTALAVLEGRAGGIGLARTTAQQQITLLILAVGVMVALAVAIWK